ncbi:tyrosine-protein phosphatase non-receptor type 23-like [Stegodyphus dumicola]|uniref:tyrosine-protein phosphatase non-receptor type 23-like n=1 Tax=Stegodyphus dumicola TaxID=202533 RepID=UPI0015AB4E6E|nr:tyrosine-protein phosphatase non-receptor type 23-like [Stegodyphus dumicola]
MNSGHGPRDVAQIAGTVSQQRKFLIQEKEQLKFCYDAVLYYAQDLLMRRGILTTRASFDDKLPGSGSTNSHVRHPSEDFILGSGGLAKLQSGIARMGLSSENVDIEKNVSKSEPSVNKSSLPVNNGDVTAENSAETSTTDTELSSEPTVISTDAESPPADKKDSIDKNLPSITSILDPSNFTLESTSSPAKRKITKENFATSKGSLSTSSSDSADPLSQLDPLWSLKK